MLIQGTKGLIDIEKHNLDQTYGTICLEENRTELNIKRCQNSIKTLQILLTNLNAGLVELID